MGIFGGSDEGKIRDIDNNGIMCMCTHEFEHEQEAERCKNMAQEQGFIAHRLYNPKTMLHGVWVSEFPRDRYGGLNSNKQPKGDE